LKLIASPDEYFLLLWNNVYEFLELIIAYPNGGQWAPCS